MTVKIRRTKFMYGAADESFVKPKQEFSTKPKISPLSTYKFSQHGILKGKIYFDKNDVPIQFKTTPDTLLVLASKVVDAIPLPRVYTWTNVDVCKWIRQYGYPQYQRTFRKNLIHGRSLLLVDADALSAMNIKNYDDIMHIAYGIRCLFYFELTKFARSISLPPQYYNELYKLLRVKSGRKYELTRRTDLYRKMQLIRENPTNLSHWEKLEKWLALEPDPLYPELFGGFRRKNLYKCKPIPPYKPTPVQTKECTCSPPCECFWTAKNLSPPWRLSCLSHKTKWNAEYIEDCKKCMPPCTCQWTSKNFAFNSVITCLREEFPKKYGLLRLSRASANFSKLERVSNIRSSLNLRRTLQQQSCLINSDFAPYIHYSSNKTNR